MSSTQWRIYVTTYVSGGYANVAEMEMRGSAGGSDLCTGGTPSASSEYTGNEATKAFDDDTGTFWSSNNFLPEWLKYTFSSAQDIVEYYIYPRSATNWMPTAWKLQYYDGANWVDQDIRSGISWTSGVGQTFT